MKISGIIFGWTIFLTGLSTGEGQQSSQPETRIDLWHILGEEIGINLGDRIRLFNYGCWCGRGGRGKVADNMDFCCKVHDFCENAFLEDWNKCNSQLRLGTEDKSFKYNKATKKCTPVSKYGISDVQQAQCHYAVCLCDMEMFRCFKRYKNEINFKKYYNYRAGKDSCAVTESRDICFENSCYTISTWGKTWPENRKTCQGLAGDLVSMETVEEWRFINEEIQKLTFTRPLEWHIGLMKENDVWKWVSGQALTIDKWQTSAGQPTGDGDVAVIAKDYPKDTQGLFNDLPETFKRPFICEIPKGDYCTTDVIVLVQGSQEISDMTLQNLKSTVQSLFSLLESSDSIATYNFALAMYAKSRNVSPFGSKRDTIEYMEKQFAKDRHDRLYDLGKGNLLNRALNKMIETFQSRPKQTKKILVIFSDGNAENKNGDILDTFKLRNTETLLKVTNKIKIVGALLPNRNNDQRMSELKSIVSEPDDAIDADFCAPDRAKIADRLATRIKRYVSVCKATASPDS